MTNHSAPILVGYKDLFFELDSRALPSFDSLQKLDFETVQPDETLPLDLQQAITKELTALHHLCTHFGFAPLVSEFALISDQRMLLRNEAARFRSYISFFLPTSPALAREYTRALTYMGTEEAGFEQIVPHSELFQDDTALIHFECASRLDVLQAEEGELQISSEPQHLTVLRQNFRLIETPHNKLERQVSVFVDKFLANVGEKEELVAAGRHLNNSTFLLLPFVRPHFKSSVPLDPTTQRRGSAGGALFLFLARSRKDASIRDLGRALSWLLAEASLRESYASFEVEHNKKELLGSMVHGTVHTIRAIGTSELSRSISFKDPPETRDDLRVRIFQRDCDEEDERRGDLLVRALKAAMLGEDTAAALLAFCEIQLNDGILRSKFQNDKEASVRKLLDEGLLLANASPATRPEYAEVELAMGERPPTADDHDGCWLIPEYYLNAKLIRGLLGEFIRNASFYGKRTDEGKVRMQCQVSRNADGALDITLTNEVPSAGSATPVTGFLERTQTVLRELNGIALEFK